MVRSVFFFQAEDGIRDLVRSRGLGDVYKRQVNEAAGPAAVIAEDLGMVPEYVRPSLESLRIAGTVSYTHLTLPTSDLV